MHHTRPPPASPTGTVIALPAAFKVQRLPPVVVTLLLILWVRVSSDAGTFFYKYSMDIQDCIDIVEKLLRQNNRKYKDSHEQLLYERGYLTGLLARIMSDDPNILHQIINKTNHR